MLLSALCQHEPTMGIHMSSPSQTFLPPPIWINWKTTQNTWGNAFKILNMGWGRVVIPKNKEKCKVNPMIAPVFPFKKFLGWDVGSEDTDGAQEIPELTGWSWKSGRARGFTQKRRCINFRNLQWPPMSIHLCEETCLRTEKELQKDKREQYSLVNQSQE